MFTKYAHLHRAFTNTISNYIYRKAASLFVILKSKVYAPPCKKVTLTNCLLPSLALTSQNVLSQVTVVDVEENLSHLITLAQLALQKGDIERAEAILNIGLKLCSDHKITMALPYVYDILITIAFAQNQNEKAEGLLVNGIEKLIQSGLADNDHYVLDFKLRLARTYSAEKKNDLAELGFKTCLEAQKLKMVQGDHSTRTGLLYVNILFWYSVHMVRNEQFQEAKKLLTTAYEYSNKIKGLTPYQELVILYTLSDLNLELGDYETALQNIQSAVMLGQGMSTIDLPKCYVKLAKVYVKLGAYDQARVSAEEAAKMAKIFSNVEAQEEAEAILKDVRKK